MQGKNVSHVIIDDPLAAPPPVMDVAALEHMNVDPKHAMLPPGDLIPRHWLFRKVCITDPRTGRPRIIEVWNRPIPVVANRRKRAERAALAGMFPHIRTKKGRIKALRRLVRDQRRARRAQEQEQKDELGTDGA